MADFAEDLRFRGLIHQMTDPALGQRLDAGRLTGYTGFDPTADSLHVGHLLQLCTCGASRRPGTGRSPWPAGAPASSATRAASRRSGRC